MMKASLQEIFSSFQGEGIFVGEPHIFVRFNGCHILCRYCDSPESEHSFARSVEEVAEEVEVLERTRGPHHAVSLTGGEPLLHVDFLEGLLPLLKERGFATYLETNGILFGALQRLLPWTDIVAMDLKPPSATGERPFWNEHERFLRIAFERLGSCCFVKVVTTQETTEDDMRRCIGIVSEVDPAIPFVIQPVTPYRDVHEHASQDVLVRFNDLALRQLTDVRVIPQIHKLIGVR